MKILSAILKLWNRHRVRDQIASYIDVEFRHEHPAYKAYLVDCYDRKFNS